MQPSVLRWTRCLLLSSQDKQTSTAKRKKRRRKCQKDFFVLFETTRKGTDRPGSDLKNYIIKERCQGRSEQQQQQANDSTRLDSTRLVAAAAAGQTDRRPDVNT
jgi:hypothetical protein